MKGSATASALPLLPFVCATLLAGCAGLPPPTEPVTLPAEAPLAVSGAGGSWPNSKWWRQYQDRTLDGLIDLALSSSPTLATAHARFDSARQSVRLAGAAAGAHVELHGGIERQRLSDNGLFPPSFLGFNWYNQTDIGVQAGYTFDWWGKQRAAVEAATDEAHAAQADRSAAALVLASSIADTYFGWQADQARLALAEQRLATAQRASAIAADRVRAGLDSNDVLHQTDTAVAAARGQIATLDGSAKLRVIALAALIGCRTTQLPPMTAKPLPAVAAALPDDLRIDLIARRADIIASRWRVAAAAKNLTSARADYFPDISINALAGLSSIDIGKLLEYGSRVPQASVAVNLPIFDSGLLQARYGARRAQLRTAVAAYRQTLTEAARDVATEAAVRAQIAAQRAQLLIEVDAARQFAHGATARVRQGVTDQRLELEATASLIERQDALLQLDEAALTADVGLQRALGGGYRGAQNIVGLEPAAVRKTP